PVGFRLRLGARVVVGARTTDRLRRLAHTAGLAERHRPPLDLVDDGVDPGLMRRGGGRAPQALPVDLERDVDDMGVLDAPVLLDRELDGGVRLVIEEALEAPELALRVLADRARHLVVLALDDGPQTHLPAGPPSYRPTAAGTSPP